jgi:propanediol dehydratase small subunit
MSRIRIVIGVLIGLCFLGLELAAVWLFDLPEIWVPIALFLFTGLAGGLLVQMQVRKSLRPYWNRACMGIRWRRRFPDSPKSEIREFLVLFVDAFAFRRKRRCCFAPDDKVMDVYRALYPPGSWADGLELETMCKMLKKQYGVDYFTSWREDITLGEIYSQTRSRGVA